ncbi:MULTISPECIES: GNAT family N-acetyltransferase [Exiguobacterium]|uniref:GNAT family N-acetyltransferase n=1 Tax=Exiguobacterium TaxID=33986 RepID=UPI0011F03DAC|nr:MULTISPECIES: GNAT family N-acetyltransferase [Exiguobacterium]
MNIRSWTTDDLPQLVGLMTQLGYPACEDVLHERFSRVTRHPDYDLLVLEDDDILLGCVGLFQAQAFEHDTTYVRIVAFVVNAKHRRRGIGRHLIQAAEDWAHARGATAVLLNSGNRPEREAAHHFYQAMGYSVTSTSYSKSLASS